MLFFIEKTIDKQTPCMIYICGGQHTGDWSNGMIGVSKTFGGSSILSSPALKTEAYASVFYAQVCARERKFTSEGMGSCILAGDCRNADNPKSDGKNKRGET